MPRPEKVEAVATIKERLEASRAVFVTEYAGLSVKQQQTLRRGLRGTDAEYKVVKMTLARRAADELGLEGLDDLLIGPTALAFTTGDPVETAKVLRDFAGENPALLIKGALLAGELLAPEKVSELADIEPRDVLLAKIAGAFQAPMANMAGLMTAFFRNSATVFQQLLDKKEEASPATGAPAEDAEADGPAAEEGSAAEDEKAQAPAAAEAEGDGAAEATEEAASDEEPAAEQAEVAEEAEAPEAQAEASAEDGDDADEASDDEPEAAEDDAADESDDDPAAEAEEDK